MQKKKNNIEAQDMRNKSYENTQGKFERIESYW